MDFKKSEQPISLPRAGLEGGILVSLLAITSCTLTAFPLRVLCLCWWYVHDLGRNLDRVWKSVQNRWHVIRTHAVALIVGVLQACSILPPCSLPVQKSTIKCIIHKIYRTLLVKCVDVEHHMDLMALYITRWTITLLDLSWNCRENLSETRIITMNNFILNSHNSEKSKLNLKGLSFHIKKNSESFLNLWSSSNKMGLRWLNSSGSGYAQGSVCCRCDNVLTFGEFSDYPQ